MSLFEAFYERCNRLERRATPDGQGGYTVSWQSGNAFSAAITGKKSGVTTSAEKSEPVETYTVTSPKGTQLRYGDVFRRRSDGAAFRATSNFNESSPPACAGFAFEQVTAERWELT